MKTQITLGSYEMTSFPVRLYQTRWAGDLPPSNPMTNDHGWSVVAFLGRRISDWVPRRAWIPRLPYSLEEWLASDAAQTIGRTGADRTEAEV